MQWTALENKVTIQRHEELAGILLLSADPDLGARMRRLLFGREQVALARDRPTRVGPVALGGQDDAAQAVVVESATRTRLPGRDHWSGHEAERVRVMESEERWVVRSCSCQRRGVCGAEAGVPLL